MRSPFQSQKTNWKYILLVMVLAFIVGVGIIWWIKTQEIPFTQLPEITKTEKPAQVEATEPAPSEIEGWKTYRNTEYGFEIKYPEDWTVSIGYCSNAYFGTDKNCSSVKYLENTNCSVNIIADKSQYDDCLKLFPANIKNVNFAGMPAYKNPSVSDMVDNYCVQKNNNYFTIFTTQPYTSPHRNPEESLSLDCLTEEGKILSSFKFIE